MNDVTKQTPEEEKEADRAEHREWLYERYAHDAFEEIAKQNDVRGLDAAATAAACWNLADAMMAEYKKRFPK